MRRFRRLISSFILFWMSMIVVVGRAEATDGLRGFDNCVVEENEIILEDFYFACRTLVIRGFIDGDVVGIASEVTVAREGHVTGDIWVIGGQMLIEGTVGDDLHFFGADLDIAGLARFPNPSTDIVAAGISVEVSSGTLIPGDVIYYGYQAILKGKVNGNVDFQGQALLIQNTVAGRVDAIVGDQEANAPLGRLPFVYSVDFRDPGLYFTEGNSIEEGFIVGNLSYEAPRRIITGERIGGEIEYQQSIQNTNITRAEQSDTFIQIMGNYIVITIRDVASIGLVGILTLNFFGTFITEPGYRVQTRPVSAFSWGFILILLAVPVILLMIVTSLLVLLVTFVITLSELTAMVSIILLVLNLGVVGGGFFLLAYLGRAITSFVIGYLLLRSVQRFWARYIGTPPPVISELWFSVLVGVIIVSLLAHIPLGAYVSSIQLVLTGIIASAGLGALFMYLRDLWYSSDQKLLVSASGVEMIAPPPPDDMDMDSDAPLGMDNLPAGFSGFPD